MIELKLSTAKGKKVCNMGEHCYAYSLNELYKKPSQEKINAYNKCLLAFGNTPNPHRFRVGNANSFGFTASWYGKERDDYFMRVETKDNSYKVWINR